LVADVELPKGARLKVEMQVPFGFGPLFDLPGAELPFRAVTPSGMDLVDVYGEGVRKGVVVMESDPAWLLPVLAFVKAHWLAILVSGFVLGVLVTMIRIFASIPVDGGTPWLLIAGIVVAVIVLSRATSSHDIKRKKLVGGTSW